MARSRRRAAYLRATRRGPQDRSPRAYTTQPVLDGSPVVRVFHDDDGDWQFFGAEPVSVDEGRLVHLHHMLDGDPSLHEVMRMATGSVARRSGPADPWSIAPDAPG